MKFLQTEVKIPAEKCVSVLSYTYGDLIVAQNNPDYHRFNIGLYEVLQVECLRVVAFPFRVFGRIAGSIELILKKKMYNKQCTFFFVLFVHCNSFFNYISFYSTLGCSYRRS